MKNKNSAKNNIKLDGFRKKKMGEKEFKMEF